MSYTPGETAMRGDIVDRLRGKYPIGPALPSGEPEFGFRHWNGIPDGKGGWIPAPPIMEEAAQKIESLRSELESLSFERGE